jgi:hypothetical protein
MGVNLFKLFLEDTLAPLESGEVMGGVKQDDRFATWEPALGRGKMGG